ncbi:hypothetical protein CH54_2635 [Yersinia rochesterensis]|uniref:Uncharacterized protein n=1 Tax=Yersinia rochesterensis TaxID=1604335 RepID=A0ABM5SID4_9GAMM|nr:hypothetical protein [Yersinia rochesterensis]AJI88246.1 hypothetical protein AW19_3153 [Yersinia frederiksenii Y225]AJJ34294.1 hypothetical protein CH54_2635 [Yersinia rochesterensis]
MPGQLIELTGGALAVLAFLIWIAVLSVRAVLRDHRRRTSIKKAAERKARQQF